VDSNGVKMFVKTETKGAVSFLPAQQSKGLLQFQVPQLLISDFLDKDGTESLPLQSLTISREIFQFLWFSTPMNSDPSVLYLPLLLFTATPHPFFFPVERHA